jgi:hypothetical protein
MFNRKDPRRARVVRGTVLYLIWLAGNGDSLNPNDPFSMNRNVLTLALEEMRQLPHLNDLTSAIRYCEEKGYLEVVWLKDTSGDFESVRLTVQGVDLVEATSTDAGVMLPSLR